MKNIESEMLKMINEIERIDEAVPAIHPPWKVDKVAKPTAMVTRANGKRVLATSILKRGKADPDYEKAKQAVKFAKGSRPRRQFVKAESAPSGKGWEKVVKGMKKHPEIDNPFALANWMKKKGYKPKKK